MKPKTKAITLTTLLLSEIVCAIQIYLAKRTEGAVFLVLVMTFCPMLAAYTLCFIFLKENRIAYCRVLVEKRQKYYKEMMSTMKMCDYHTAYKEISKLIEKDSRLRLYRYTPFRAWYKDWIDRSPAMAHYSIKKCTKWRDLVNDKYYDPSAPPKSRYFKYDDDKDFSWDDELDDYGDPKPLTRDDLEEIVEDALEDYGRKHERNSVADGLSIGIGIGIGNSLTGGHGIGSGK